MSDRPTPETDAEWDRLQMLPGGGYSSQVAGVKLAFGMARWASTLERQRDEARELARQMRVHLMNLVDYEPCGCCHNDDAETDWTEAKLLIAKAKEVLS